MNRSVTTLAIVMAILIIPAVPASAAPAAPEITTPTNGAAFCSDGEHSLDVAGTADASVSISVRANGSPVASTTADAGGAWTTGATLGDGTHELTAVANDGTEDSPASAAVSVTVDDVSDALGSISSTYAVISPANADGIRDSATIAVPVSRQGSVGLQIRHGTTVVRSVAPTLVAAGGNRTFTWDGKDGSGSFVASRTYEVLATWTSGDCTTQETRSITVDNVRPQISSFSDSPNTFFPVESDAFIEYKDTTSISYTGLTERARVWLYVYRDGSSTPVRKIDDGWDDNAGGGSITWNGRTAGGTLLDPGIYDYRFRLRDPYGNERFTSRGEVRISHKRLVERTVTMTRRGDSFFDYGESTCGDVSTGLSDWSTGVWLYAYDCYYDEEEIDGAYVKYSFDTPSAAYYHSFTLKAYGYSLGGDALYGFLRDYEASDDDVVGYIAGSTASTRTFGTKLGPEYVSSGGRSQATLFLASACDCTTEIDYDIRDVSLKVRYAVLA